MVSVQNRYSFADRESDPVLDRCESDGFAFIPWFPLGAGDAGRRAIDRIAADHGATPYQVALAWLLARSPATLPIPGTSSVEHLEANIAAASLHLSEDEVGELAAAGA